MTTAQEVAQPAPVVQGAAEFDTTGAVGATTTSDVLSAQPGEPRVDAAPETVAQRLDVGGLATPAPAAVAVPGAQNVAPPEEPPVAQGAAEFDPVGAAAAVALAAAEPPAQHVSGLEAMLEEVIAGEEPSCADRASHLW